MTDPRIKAVETLLKRYPSRNLPGKASIGRDATVPGVLAAADSVDPVRALLEPDNDQAIELVAMKVLGIDGWVLPLYLLTDPSKPGYRAWRRDEWRRAQAKARGILAALRREAGIE